MRSRSFWSGIFAVSLLLTAAVAGAADPAPSAAAPAAKEGSKMETGKNPIVVITTSMGTIEAELYADKAPMSVKNFLAYVDGGHYDGTVFHRVIPGFMIQGGGMTADMNQKPTKPPIKNEADNGLKNTAARSRWRAPASSTARPRSSSSTSRTTASSTSRARRRGFGYAVFGKVTSGMDVVDKIENVSTTSKGMNQDVPIDPVVIKSITVKK